MDALRFLSPSPFSLLYRFTPSAPAAPEQQHYRQQHYLQQLYSNKNSSTSTRTSIRTSTSNNIINANFPFTPFCTCRAAVDRAVDRAHAAHDLAPLTSPRLTRTPACHAVDAVAAADPACQRDAFHGPPRGTDR